MRAAFWIALALATLLLSLFVSMGMGRYDIPIEKLAAFLSWDFFGFGAQPADSELYSNIICNHSPPNPSRNISPTS